MLIERFAGEQGAGLLLEEINRQPIISGIAGACEDVAAAGELLEVPAGRLVIEERGHDNDIYFVIFGSLGIFVNSKRIATRSPGDSIGEMSIISHFQERSASVIADSDCVLLKISEAKFSKIAEKYPHIWKRLAGILSKRLLQRNTLIRRQSGKLRLFVMSSLEALPVARAIESAFAKDSFATAVWANGAFRESTYTLETLETELEKSDFAVVLAHPDEKTVPSHEDWPTPRDKVVFELGFCIGKLGRQRAILMEPRGRNARLPSDLAGITTIRYDVGAGADISALMSPACNQLREHILGLGRNI